jgi:hypothetical protein
MFVLPQGARSVGHVSDAPPDRRNLAGRRRFTYNPLYRSHEGLAVKSPYDEREAVISEGRSPQW